AFPRASGTASMIENCKANGISYWPFDMHSRYGAFPQKCSISSNLRMLSLLRTVQPDIVQITAGWQPDIWPAAWSCALCKIPVLAVFQLAVENCTLHPLKIRLLAWGRRRRQRWMAVSQQNLSALGQTFGTDPYEIGVLYNGTEIPPEAHAQNEAETEAIRREVRIELALPLHARLLFT